VQKLYYFIYIPIEIILFHTAMDLKKKNVSECSHAIDDKAKSVCMEETVINQLSEAFKDDIKHDHGTDPEKVIETIKDVVGCDSESCLLTNPQVTNVIGEDTANQQLTERFKPEGPSDSNDWFSNSNIDNVLKQVEEKYKNKNFLHVEFQMRDFETTGGELSNIDMAQKYNDGMRCFGVVFNTDKSTGRGQHWFSIFGDFSKDPFTIEYFNSSGEDPLDEICSWMKKTKQHLIKNLDKSPDTVKDVVVTKLVNQSDNHSCGSYSLYYIMSRLAGVPYKHFSDNKIGDAKMHEFRREHLFRQSS
jgi:hypothetical protein